MKKNYLLLIIMMLFFFIAPKSTYAFMGDYSYDINSVSYGHTTYGTGVIIDGWAVLNNADDKLMHNISPKYTLIIEAKDKNNNVISTFTFNNEKENSPTWEQCDMSNGVYTCLPSSRPYDYTKAYYHVGDAGIPYPTDSYNTDRCAAMGLKGSENSKFLINTTFQFIIPTIALQGLAKSSSVDKIYLTLHVQTGLSRKPYNQIFTCGATNISKDIWIPLTIQQTSIKDPSLLDDYNLTIKNTARQVTVIVGGGYVQGNYKAFLSGDSYRLVEKSNQIIKQPDGFKPNLSYVKGGKYDIVDMSPINDLGALQPKYNYYHVKVKLGGSGTVANGGNTDAYIPAFWANPTSIDGKPTYIEPKIPECDARLECSTTNIDKPGSTCPAKDPECCSLCELDEYKNKNFCNNPTKCGTCDVCEPTSLYYDTYKDTNYCKNECKTECDARPECSVTSIDKGSCPTGESECCSLCDLDKYKNTDFCKNPKKCGEESCDLCQPTSPYYNAYKDTDLCTNPKKCGTDDDNNGGGGDGSKCPYDDPQRCYCFYYGSQDPDTCAIYKEKDKSTARKNKCNASAIIEDIFKYPTSGYGDNKFSNDACKISCEEIVKTTFQPQQNLKAGMGYEYPIQVSGTRYCTAQYKNDTWSSDLVKAAENANAAYDKMKTALENARDDDNACGFIAYETQNPSPTNCASDETLNKANQTCEKVVSYDNACPLDYTYKDETENCEMTVQDCSSYLASPQTRTKKTYTCPRGGTLDVDGVTCKICEDKIVTDEPTKCLSGTDTDPNGTSEDGGCLLSHNACNSPYYLRGDVCQKAVCSASSYTDWSVAQDHINSHITEASNAKANYDSWVKAFNSLISDHSICDSYATSNVYKGSSDISVSYSETQGTMQVSKQKAFTITESTIGGSTIIKTNPKQYDIKEDKSRTLSIGSSAYNNSTISLYGGSYIEYIDKPNVTYYDFWNEKSTASNKLEFSKFYYVQRYTGELSTTISSGYDLGGRRVYTDFYQKSGTQNFSSNFDKIGPNLPLSQDNSMKIKPSSNKLTCSYNVDNRIFPQEGGKNYPSYGSVAFTFRQISLTDPFPNRDPRTNWVGQTIKGYEIYNNDPKYKYYLNPTCMQAIRIYNNQSYGYGSFNSNNPYKSDFLSKYENELITPNSCK